MGGTAALTAPRAAASEPVEVAALTTLLKGQAFGLGFDLAGVVRLGPAESADAFDAWIAAGYAGEMDYLARGAEKRRDTRLTVPASRAHTTERAAAVSALVVALDYGGREPDGPVARYARGDDYHDVMQGRLEALHRWVEARVGHAVPGRAYVDTGPLLERDLARRAGLGWFGKNTNLIHPQRGSFFFLGALLLGIELAPDAPFEADRCGTCTRCLDACPTDAFVGPRVLDATRCISYLTIEQRGAIPEALRASVGAHAYGCDVCQDVCPWNVRFARELQEPTFAPRAAIAGKDARAFARAGLAMDVEAYRAAFRGSPMKRAKVPAMQRNAAVVLGNVGTADDVDVLTRVLDEEPDAMVREHAAWALARLAASPGDSAAAVPAPASR